MTESNKRISAIKKHAKTKTLLELSEMIAILEDEIKYRPISEKRAYEIEITILKGIADSKTK